jgi:hypothetical protein
MIDEEEKEGREEKWLFLILKKIVIIIRAGRWGTCFRRRRSARK